MFQSEEIEIAVPWGHVSAKCYGSAVDFPVLLLHGLMDNAGSFHRLVGHLPPDYYYVAIDLPGHGWSSHLPAGLPLNFFDYVLAVRYVVEELGWSRFHLIGQSFGAQLCLFYSLTYPGRVQRLVVLEGFYPRIVPERKVLPWLQGCLASAEDRQPDSRTFTRDEVMHTLRCGRKFALTSAAAEAMFERSVTELAGGVYRYNRDPRLKNYVLPLLGLDQLMCLILDAVGVKALGIFTHSSADIFTPELVRESKKLVESLVDIKIIFVEGNHDVHNNCPERIAPFISEFLSDWKLTSKL